MDGSHEAAVALCAARPLLALASEVHVVTVEEKAKRDFPPIDASEYLSRHGIASEIHEWPRKGRTVEEALKRMEDANIRVKGSKCAFARAEVEFMGTMVDARGHRVHPKAIAAWFTPFR